MIFDEKSIKPSALSYMSMSVEEASEELLLSLNDYILTPCSGSIDSTPAHDDVPVAMIFHKAVALVLFMRAANFAVDDGRNRSYP